MGGGRHLIGIKIITQIKIPLKPIILKPDYAVVVYMQCVSEIHPTWSVFPWWSAVPQQLRSRWRSALLPAAFSGIRRTTRTPETSVWSDAPDRTSPSPGAPCSLSRSTLGGTSQVYMNALLWIRYRCYSNRSRTGRNHTQADIRVCVIVDYAGAFQ